MPNLYKEHIPQYLTPLKAFTIMAQAQVETSPKCYKPWFHLSELAKKINFELHGRINSPLKYKIFVDTTTTGLLFHRFLHEFLSKQEEVPDTERFMLLANLMCKHLKARHRRKKCNYGKVCTYFGQTLKFINTVVTSDLEI